MEEQARALGRAYAETRVPWQLVADEAPLSGEWADGPFTIYILDALGIDPESEDAQWALDAWEDGYQSAPWRECMVINLEFGNATMRTREDVARALKRLAARIENTEELSGTILDTDGNNVGNWGML